MGELALAVRVPPCPRGCAEQRPMGPGELVRWRWKSRRGADVTVALMADAAGPWVQWWTGPSSFHIETGDPAEVWQAVEVLAVVAAWLAGPAEPDPAPAPAGQASLFDPQPEEAESRG